MFIRIKKPIKEEWKTHKERIKNIWIETNAHKEEIGTCQGLETHKRKLNAHKKETQNLHTRYWQHIRETKCAQIRVKKISRRNWMPTIEFDRFECHIQVKGDASI
jgi:hypothetical protein